MMEYTSLIHECLLVLLIGLLSATEGANEGWISVPGTVSACAGDNASLWWEYDEAQGVPQVVNVARSELTITLVSKIGSEDAKSHRPRATFLPNAGVAISNISAADNGKYESTVVFSDQHSLVNEAILTVYEGCPNRQEFDNPEVYKILPIPNVNKTTPLEDFQVHFKVKVPAADPKVNCMLSVGDRQYDCESGEATVEPADPTNINIIVRLSHPAMGESSRSMIYTKDDDSIGTRSAQTVTNSADTVTKTNTPEGDVGFNTTVIGWLIAVIIALVIIVVLSILYCRCHHHINDDNVIRKKGDECVLCCIGNTWSAPKEVEVREKTPLTGNEGAARGVPVQVSCPPDPNAANPPQPV